MKYTTWRRKNLKNLKSLYMDFKAETGDDLTRFNKFTQFMYTQTKYYNSRYKDIIYFDSLSTKKLKEQLFEAKLSGWDTTTGKNIKIIEKILRHRNNQKIARTERRKK